MNAKHRFIAMSLLFFPFQAFSNSPNLNTYQIRRPMPLLLPDLGQRIGGLMYFAEVHQDPDALTLNNGASVSLGTTVTAFTLAAPFSPTGWLNVAPLLQLSLNNPLYLVFGTQGDLTLLRRGIHAWKLDVQYSGVLYVIFPSGGIQSHYEVSLVDTDLTTWTFALGGQSSLSYFFYHRVLTEGMGNPSERYIGYVLSGGPFLGSVLQISRFMMSAKFGYLFRHALPDEDGTVYSAAAGFFGALSIGITLGSSKNEKLN